MTLILDTNILIALYRIYLVYGSRAVKNKWLKLLIKHDALEIWIPRTVLKEFTPYPPEKGKKFISLLRKLCNTSGIKFTICPIHNKHAILTLTLDLDIELGEANGMRVLRKLCHHIS